MDAGAVVVSFKGRAGGRNPVSDRAQPQVVHETVTKTTVVGDKTRKSTRRVAPRVQLRLALDEIDQADRDVTMIRDAAERALRMIRQARKSREPALLGAVRDVFEDANRHLSAYRHGR